MVQVVSVLQKLIYFYELIILVWCVMSFVPTRAGSFIEDIKAVLNTVCMPFIGIFRRFIPAVGGLDFSPVIAVFVLTLVSRLLTYIIL